MAIGPGVYRARVNRVRVLVAAIKEASKWHDRVIAIDKKIEELKDKFNAYPPEERVKDEAWAIRTQWVELRRQGLELDAKRYIATNVYLADVTGNDIRLWPAHLHRYHSSKRDSSQAGVIDREACNVQ
jgi:hypothetical protein